MRTGTFDLVGGGAVCLVAENIAAAETCHRDSDGSINWNTVRVLLVGGKDLVLDEDFIEVKTFMEGGNDD